MHHDGNEQENTVRSECAVCRSAWKIKKGKGPSPLQALVLPVAYQEIPEKECQVEEFPEHDDDDDGSDDSEAEKQSHKQHKEFSRSDGISAASPQSVPPS